METRAVPASSGEGAGDGDEGGAGELGWGRKHVDGLLGRVAVGCEREEGARRRETVQHPLSHAPFGRRLG